MLTYSMSVWWWVCVGLLSPLLLLAAAECSDTETLKLKPIPSRDTHPSDCLMECTGMTYIRKLQLQDQRNIRFTDSKEGDLGEYCWSTELQCSSGESFQCGFVVLPVDVSAVTHQQLEVKTSTTDNTLTLHTQQQQQTTTTIPDGCGLQYDVTHHFTSQSVETSFCIRVVTQGDVLGDKILRCPPYLVTFWQRDPNQSTQQGAG